MTTRSVAHDSLGNVHVAYGEEHLYHSWQDGAVWHTENVDTAAHVGTYAAIAIAADGAVHIAYYDAPTATSSMPGRRGHLDDHDR